MKNAKSTRRLLVSNLKWNYVQNAAMLVLGIATSVVVVRGLGSIDYGKLSVLMAFFSFLLLVSGLGFETAISVELPILKAQPNFERKQSFMMRKLVTYRVFIIAIFLLSIVGFSGQIANLLKSNELQRYIFLIASSIFVAQLAALFNTIFLVHLDIRLRTIIAILSTLCNLGLFYFFIYILSLNIRGYWYATLIGAVVNFLLIFRLTNKILKPPPEKIDMRPALLMGRYTWLNNFVDNFLNENIDILLCSFFLVSPKFVGNYRLVFRITRFLTFFNLGFAPIARTIMAQKYGESKENLIPYCNTFIKVAFILSAPFLVFAFFQAKNIFFVLYGHDFIEAGRVMMVYLIFCIVRIILGGHFLGAVFKVTKDIKTYTIIFIFAGVLNLILDLAFIPLWSIWGALYATGISLISMSFAHLVLFYKKFNALPPILFMLKGLSIFVCASLPLLLFVNKRGVIYLVLSFLIFVSLSIFLTKCIGLISEEDKYYLQTLEGFPKRILEFLNLI